MQPNLLYIQYILNYIFLKLKERKIYKREALFAAEQGQLQMNTTTVRKP